MQAAADPALDLLAKLGMSAALAFHDHLSEDLLAALAAGHQRGADTPELLEIAQEILENYAPNLAVLLSDARLASWLSGAGKIADLVPASAGAGGPPGSPPVAAAAADFGDGFGLDVWRPLVEAATEDLLTRQLLPKEDYEAASKAVRDQSFTVAQQSSLDALEDIRQAVTEAVETGSGWPEFRERVEEALGAGAIGPAHLENIFRTNAQTAYSRGMDAILDTPIVRDLMPYEEVLPIRDTRLTHLCEVIAESGIQGTGIFRRDDPVYQHFKSPRHWQDRCGRRALTIEQAAELGIKEAQEWLRTGQDPRTGFVAWPPVELPKGWTPGGQGGPLVLMSWRAHTGTRGMRKGQQGWKNDQSGRIVYQPQPPKERTPEAAQAPASTTAKAAPPPAAKAPAPAKPGPSVRKQAAPAPAPAPQPAVAPVQELANYMRMAAQTVTVSPKMMDAAKTTYNLAKTQGGNMFAKIREAAGIEVQALKANPRDSFAWEKLRGYGHMVEWAKQDAAKQGKPTAPAAAPAQAKPIPKPAQAAPAGMHPKAAALHQKIHAVIQGQNHLDPKTKAHYSQSVKKVLARMPEKALDRFSKHAGNFSFYNDSKELGAALAKKSPKLQAALSKGATIGGAFGKDGSFHLDGNFTQKTAKDFVGGGIDAAHHTYAHEFAHAIDGPGHEISGGAEWQQAWKKELGGGALSKYATTQASEGFAEFARLAYASDVDRRKIEQTFPRCVALWKKHGIWSNP